MTEKLTGWTPQADSPSEERAMFNELLATNWIDASKEKPPRGVFVICDGWHIKTMVVAAYQPDSPDDEFPWKISCGNEISEWAEDTISKWQHLPGSLCC